MLLIFDACQFPTMTDGAVITFPASIFEGDDLLIFALLDDFAGDFRSGIRSPEFARRRHASTSSKRRRFARFDVQKIDIDRVAFRDAILPATGFNNCVSHNVRFLGGKSRAKSHRRRSLASERWMTLRRSMSTQAA